jgi:hypothetical protein
MRLRRGRAILRRRYLSITLVSGVSSCTKCTNKPAQASLMGYDEQNARFKGATNIQNTSTMSIVSFKFYMSMPIVHPPHHNRASPPCIHARWLLMMSTNAGFKLAPPTRKPSISGCLANSLQFFSVTLPPYRMRVFSAASLETAFCIHSRIALWTSCACSVVATLPVPMALGYVSHSFYRMA